MQSLLPLLHAWQREFAGRVSFLLVYILEAHAVDEWNIGLEPELRVSQTRTLDQRQTMAQLFQRKLDVHLPIYLDSPSDNAFQQYFQAWPLRAFVVDSCAVLRWASVPTDTGHFVPSLLHDAISSFFPSEAGLEKSTVG